jgi:RNA polymerase sigma factor (sigma-70 family)
MVEDKRMASDQPAAESTADLFDLVRRGDAAARNRLLARYLPVLKTWAHGRLPTGARDLVDTDDLVQVTLVRTLNHLEGFEPRHEGAFLAYLRRALLNQIRDEIRKMKRRPERGALEDDFPDSSPSPLEQAIGSEAAERYESALARLPKDYQEAVLLRIEFGYTYDQMAEALGRPTSNAARLLVSRALVRLAKEMNERA